jgi:hypothetical protein
MPISQVIDKYSCGIGKPKKNSIMTKNKKSIIIATILAASVLTLTACGSKDKEDTPAQENSETAVMPTEDTINSSNGMESTPSDEGMMDDSSNSIESESVNPSFPLDGEPAPAPTTPPSNN